MLVEKSMHPDWLSNAFVVAAEGGPAVFVDSGADVAPLVEAVERWGSTPVAILRTHAHGDHVENEDELVRRYSIPRCVNGDHSPRGVTRASCSSSNVRRSPGPTRLGDRPRPRIGG